MNESLYFYVKELSTAVLIIDTDIHCKQTKIVYQTETCQQSQLVESWPVGYLHV